MDNDEFESPSSTVSKDTLSVTSQRPSPTPSLLGSFQHDYEASQAQWRAKMESLEEALTGLPLDVKVRSIIICFICDHYDARTRQYLVRMTRSQRNLLSRIEDLVLYELAEGKPQQDDAASERVTREAGSTLSSRKGIMATSAAVVAGGAALAVTAGLAAPLVLPAVAGLLGTAAITGTAGVATVVTVFGAAGAGLSGYKMARHFEGVQDIRFIPLSTRRHAMSVHICISGWYADRRKVPGLWAFMPPEAWVLQFEPELMERLGNQWEEMAVSTVTGLAITEAVKVTVLAGTMAAIAWPLTLLQLGNMLDHPWWLAQERAKKCGRALGRALKDRAFGTRPISLFGYSLGALVVLYCLLELAEEPRTFGLIEHVVILGLPAKTPSPTVMSMLRKIVAGRFIHGYCRTDWLLKFLFRTTKFHIGDVAGLVPIDVEGIESVDFSDEVVNHADYEKHLQTIIMDLLCLYM